MENRPGDIHQDSDFIFYPTNKVVGIIDEPDDCKAALLDLRAAGFTADEVEVLTGEEGAHRVDPTGEEHGRLGRIVRWLQKFGDMEPVHVKRHEQELLAGHYGIGVIAKEPETREKVLKILKTHRGHFINFYGKWMIEALEV